MDARSAAVCATHTRSRRTQRTLAALVLGSLVAFLPAWIAAICHVLGALFGSRVHPSSNQTISAMAR